MNEVVEGTRLFVDGEDVAEVMVRLGCAYLEKKVEKSWWNISRVWINLQKGVAGQVEKQLLELPGQPRLLYLATCASVEWSAAFIVILLQESCISEFECDDLKPWLKQLGYPVNEVQSKVAWREVLFEHKWQSSRCKSCVLGAAENVQTARPVLWRGLSKV